MCTQFVIIPLMIYECVYIRGLSEKEILKISQNRLVKICKMVFQAHTKSSERICFNIKSSLVFRAIEFYNQNERQNECWQLKIEENYTKRNSPGVLSCFILSYFQTGLISFWSCRILCFNGGKIWIWKKGHF